MRRSAAVGILMVVLVAVVAGVVLMVAGDDTVGPATGCTGVRAAYRQVNGIERGAAVPTSADYTQAGLAVRRVAVVAPSGVAVALTGLADAYARLGGLFEGFDPNDESTYHVIEDSTAAVELQQAKVDVDLPTVRKWLDERCT